MNRVVAINCFLGADNDGQAYMLTVFDDFSCDVLTAGRGQRWPTASTTKGWRDQTTDLRAAEFADDHWIAPICSGELAAHGPRGVRIVAQVHCPQDGLAKVFRIVERSQGASRLFTT